MGVPTEQFVPETEKSAATTLASDSDAVTLKVKTEELLGVGGAPSWTAGGPVSNMGWLEALSLEEGPTSEMSEESDTELLLNARFTDPSLEQLTLIVKVVPELADGVAVQTPAEVPSKLKSPAPRP